MKTTRRRERAHYPIARRIDGYGSIQGEFQSSKYPSFPESDLVMKVENALKEYKRTIVGLPNVTGVGVGKKNGEDSIIVFVAKKIPESQLDRWAVIPKKIGAFATDVRLERRKSVRERQCAPEVVNVDSDLPAEILSRMQLYFCAAR
jgi:hypothetical protein